MIAIGITVGSIVAGAWSKKVGFVLPARAFGVLTVIIFVVMALLPLPRWDATSLILIMGFGLAGSILGLSVLYAHLPPAATAVATSLVVTAAFVHGAILQTVIGTSLASASKVGVGGVPAGMFTIYQHGMVWLIGSVVAAALASFFFKKSPPQVA